MAAHESYEAYLAVLGDYQHKALTDRLQDSLIRMCLGAHSRAPPAATRWWQNNMTDKDNERAAQWVERWTSNQQVVNLSFACRSAWG
ncbi:unnamed protein product [Schistocephalus solidus]|uniref:MLTR_LBD domain-containing protein n=1 Tax=Schistocephalus solidus TaxID=70667 RepID=A0A183S885_SCHSO|nr:unnamed protein product [Schistocephalus solidus]